MTIHSTGYPTDIGDTNIDWAQMQWGLGRRYWVYNDSMLKVSPKTDGTRQVNIAAGHFGAWGVHDYNDAVATVTLPSVTSGTEWFLIAARRNWNTGNVGTTFVVIDAGTTAAIPAHNQGGDGLGDTTNIDDQPLALVPLTAGSTVPGTPIDLRVIGSGESSYLQAHSTLALSYLTYVGVRVRIGNVFYTRVIDGTGSSAWETDPLIVQSGPGIGNNLSVSASDGWATVSEFVQTGTIAGGTITVDLMARRTAAQIDVPDAQHGNLNGINVMRVQDTRFMPARDLLVDIEYWTAGSFTYGGRAEFTSTGYLQLVDGQPGTNIRSGPSGAPSIRTHIVFNRES